MYRRARTAKAPRSRIENPQVVICPLNTRLNRFAFFYNLKSEYALDLRNSNNGLFPREFKL
jgi:hypothetical protein